MPTTSTHTQLTIGRDARVWFMSGEHGERSSVEVIDRGLALALFVDTPDQAEQLRDAAQALADDMRANGVRGAA